MANSIFCFEPLGAAQDVYDHCQGYAAEGGLNKRKHNHLFETENWDYMDDHQSDYGLHQEKKGVLSPKDYKQILNSDFPMQEDVQFNISSLLNQPQHESTNMNSVLCEQSSLVEGKQNPCRFSLKSLELLKNYNAGVKRMKGDQFNHPPPGETASINNGQILSTEEVMRVAGARFIQYFVQTDDLSMLRHPFGYALSGLSYEESQDVELAHLLLASAEKVGNHQFDRASGLLTECENLSSRTGNPVQRVAYRFAEALRERIDRETGQNPWNDLGGEGRPGVDIEEAMKSPQPAIVECHQLVPFSQVSQFAGMQAIVEHVGSAKKVHLIDLGIKSGVLWTILMQALAVRPACHLEHFKITAIGTSRGKIEETGKRLLSFAENLHLPFTFKVIVVSDMKDLTKGLFELEEDEVIAVYSPLALRTMLHQPDQLDSLMRVIKSLNPCIMVVTEVEANHNSPVLMNRFIEALFYYSTFFDCLEVCMGRNNKSRMILEECYLGGGIQNIVATEGMERTTRNVGIDVWRAFFRRFGLVERDLSPISLYQASLIIKKFACWSSCTLNMNKKCLLIGWKGTPLHSVSVWKFN